MSIVNVDGMNLHYEMAGRGKAIVFLHGYTGSSGDWMNQMPVLASKYKVIAMDHRGHGKSDAPSREEDCSLETFVADVRHIMNHLGIERCCLVGHSLGGFISLEFALKYSPMLTVSSILQFFPIIAVV